MTSSRKRTPSAPEDRRIVRVFLASPGDLAVERRAFKDQIDLLNLGFGGGADVQFVPLGCEDTLATVGRRSQAVINEEIHKCDVFVLAMHRRWGQPAAAAKPFSSYTEEEFHRALDRFKKTTSPEIFVFIKHVDAVLGTSPLGLYNAHYARPVTSRHGGFCSSESWRSREAGSVAPIFDPPDCRNTE